jgi:hypothetical protein
MKVELRYLCIDFSISALISSFLPQIKQSRNQDYQKGAINSQYENAVRSEVKIWTLIATVQPKTRY